MKTWLLLRGLGRDKRHWGDFVMQFQHSFSHDKVLTIDTLGNGEYSQLKSPLSIQAYTDHCRETLAKIHDQKPINLVALSLGGMVAMDWAERFGDQLQSVNLINTSAANLTPPHKRLKLRTLISLLQAMLLKRDDESVEKAIIQATSNRQYNQTTILDWVEFRHSNSTSIGNIIRQLLAAASFKVSDKLKQQSGKIVVYNSKYDQIVNAIASYDLSQYLDCPLVVHPRAGHDLPLDAGHWLIEQIKRHNSKDESNTDTVQTGSLQLS